MVHNALCKLSSTWGIGGPVRGRNCLLFCAGVPRGVRREVLRGFTKSSWGSGGRCEPPSEVRGGAPEDFEIDAFQGLRTHVSLSFLSQCCYTNIHAILFIHSHPHHFQLNEVVPNHTLWYQKRQCQIIAQFWVLFFTCTMKLVGVLNFGNSSSLWSKAKRSCSQSYPHALSASPTVGSTACTCVLDSLYSPWDEALPHWCCPGLQQVDCERSASTIFSQRLMLNVQNRSKMQHFGRVRSVSCHTSCESVVHCLSAPLPESGHQAYTSSHAVNERTFFSSAKGVTLRESPLSLAKNTNTWAPRQCQWRAICPQQPNFFLTLTDDDVDQSWKQGSFHWFLPGPYAKRPEKRWLCTRRCSFCWEKRVAVEDLLLVMAPFRTEAVLTVLHRNDPPWPRPDSAVSNSPPRATRSCVLCNDQILESWMNVACACDETRLWSIAKTCSQAVSAHAVDFETKLETSRGVHWQRWTPPVYAPGSGHESSADWLTATEQRDKNVAAAYSCLFCLFYPGFCSIPLLVLSSVLFSLLSCSFFYSFYSFYWALVLSPLLSYSYCLCCYSLYRSSLYSSSLRRYCLHLRGSSSVPSSGVFFSSTSSPSSIVESAADVSLSSAPSSNLRVYSGCLSSEAPHFFTHTCPSGLFSSSPSWLLWFLKYSSAHPSVRRSVALSLVAPTAILIKSLSTVPFCLLGACAGLWVAVFFLFVFFSLALLAEPAGHARSYFTLWILPVHHMRCA